MRSLIQGNRIQSQEQPKGIYGIGGGTIYSDRAVERILWGGFSAVMKDIERKDRNAPFLLSAVNKGPNAFVLPNDKRVSHLRHHCVLK